MAKWGSFVWGDSTKWGHAVADYPHRVPLTIKIAGVDRSNSIDPITILIKEVATKQDSRASFDITNGGAMNLAELDSVIIAGWEQQHEFAGYIWKLEEVTRGVQLDYRIDCTDYTWDLQHPEALVDEEYIGKSDQYIIQDFMATSCPGIEVDTYVEEVNSNTYHMSFDNETPFAVIERLAEDAGAEWYVDFGPVAGDPTKWAYLHYFDSGTNAAPYSLSDTPDFSASFPYKNVSEFTEAPLANKVVVVGRDLTATRTTGVEADYGRWLVAKVVDLDITTTAQANSVGDQFLTEVAASASYRLDAHEPGLRAGQNVTFVNAIRGVNDSFMIMSLSKRFERAGLAAYTVQLGKYIPSLAAIIVSDSDAGGLTGTLICDAIKAELGAFEEVLFYVPTGDPYMSFNIAGTDLFTLGIDDSDYDKFKISLDDILGVDDIFTIDLEGAVTLGVDEVFQIDSVGDIDIFSDVSIKEQKELRFYDDGNYVGFEAPTLAADQMWTLPTADGTANQVLQTDGAGALSWATAGTGDVVGPASSTDNAIVRWDGTTGKLLQNSDITLFAYGNGTAMYAAAEFWLRVYDGTMFLRSVRGNIDVDSSRDILIDAGDELSIDATNDIVIRSDDGNVTIYSNTLTSTSGNLQVGWDLDVVGTLTKGGGAFRIDHPLDPENKWLYHSMVESPDMMNVYNNNVILDEDGKAVIELPKWFTTLNRDFRYQLTPIDQPMSGLYISQGVQNNVFEIAGGAGGGQVSWQITGIRQDKWANEHRIQVEVDKED